MNRQPFGKPPRRWRDRLSPAWVRMTRGYRIRQLKKLQNIVAVHADNLRVISAARQANQGILIVANHSAHYDSNSLYVAADRIRTPMYFMTAWQVFGVSSPRQCLAMQMMGCFSVDRESNDRVAFKRATEILRDEPYPLVVFPEGDIYHTTDHVKPFREGAAAIAFSAAKRAERDIVAVPCGIRFVYLDDPTPRLHEVLGQLEERLFLRPAHTNDLPERIHRVADSLLALKELDFLGETRKGEIPRRIRALSECVLDQLERKYAVKPHGETPVRVKALRQKIIGMQDESAVQSNGTGPATDFEEDLDTLFVVIQLYSYPGDYLLNDPSIERLAETVDKLEEDVLQVDYPSVKGTREVHIRFGEAIPVVANGNRRQATIDLTEQLHSEVRELLDSTGLEVART